MNFSMTFSDIVGLKSASAEENARASVTRAIYDAIRYDSEFRNGSFAMLNEKRYEELRLAIMDLLANETARLLSDAAGYVNEPCSEGEGLARELDALMSAQAAGGGAGNLASAFGLLDDDSLDLIACYREAYSRFDMEMDLYRELKRESDISARPRISEA